MSTRGVVAIKKSDGSYRGIWCQHDSYPDHLGDTLFKSYNTEEKVNELIDHGDASSIDDTINECCFYADHGEELSIDEYASREEIVRKCDDDVFMEYLYLFEDGKWYIYFQDSRRRYIKDGQPIEYKLLREMEPKDEDY